MTPLEFERALTTEAQNLTGELRKRMMAAINKAFAERKTAAGILSLLASELERVFSDADMAIINASMDFGRLAADVSRDAKLTEALKAADAGAGTITKATKDSSTRIIAAVSAKVASMVQQGASVDKVKEAIKGTRATGYTDGFVQVALNSKAKSLDASARNARSTGDLYRFEKSRDVIGYVWHATLDSRTCTSCQALAGKKFYFNRSGMKPRPPLHPHDRCYLSPIYEGGDHAPVQTFAEWAKDPDNQDELREALGPSRYKLWAEGKLKIERFNSVDLQPLTLDEIKAKSGAAWDKAGLE